ncbi:SRPBCC domain-containing protein [Nocardiopsis rhodophaea]
MRPGLNPGVETDTFRYTIHIHAAPKLLWQALTDPALTAQFWGGTVFETDWEEGSPMVWKVNGAEITHPDQRVLVSDPPCQLSYTWHTFTPEWAKQVEVEEELRARLASEPRIRVT